MTIAHFCIDVMKHELARFAPADQEQVRKSITHVKRVMRRLDVETVNIAYARSAAPIIGDFKKVQRLMLEHRIAMVPQKPNERVLSELLFDIPVHERETVAIKTGYSACTSGVLMGWLLCRNVKTVLLSGLWETAGPDEKAACIRATARDLAREDYRPIIISEATDALNLSASPWLDPRNAEERVANFKAFGVDVMPLAAVRALIKREHAAVKLAAG